MKKLMNKIIIIIGKRITEIIKTVLLKNFQKIQIIMELNIRKMKNI